MRKPETCETCFYMRRRGAELECRLHAPVWSAAEPWGRWPNVLRTDWCGEYLEELEGQAARVAA